MDVAHIDIGVGETSAGFGGQPGIALNEAGRPSLLRKRQPRSESADMDP